MANNDQRTVSRRTACTTFALFSLGVSSLTGCSLMKGGNDPDAEADAALAKLMAVPEPPDLVREAAVAQGLRPIRIDGVALVNSLSGSGGAANPSIYRDQLLDDMTRQDIDNPNLILESSDTALVTVSAIIRPGARRGDAIDVRVKTPPRSQATDLHGGWLLDTRMRHQQVLQSAVRRSDVLGVAIGPVLTRADYSPTQDQTYNIEGRIIGGGRVQEDRKLGLILRPEFKHAKMAKSIERAVNDRFFFFDGSTRRGIAKAVEDDFVEVEVHPRYRENVGRMMSVVRAIGMNRKDNDPQTRLADLAAKLQIPATAADAAIQLESIGDEAIPTLIQGTKSSNPELAFYAAESLAYLNRTEAIDALERSARDVPAFRFPSMIALQVIDSQLATDALSRLMTSPSLETRYSAFCAIRRRPDARLILRSTDLSNHCKMYAVNSDAPPAVVVSLRDVPEVVMYGNLNPLKIDGFLRGSDGIIIRPSPTNPTEILLSRFRAGKPDLRSTAPATAAGLAHGIVSVGGRYGDIVATLRMAKESGAIVDQFAIDPLPETIRRYHRSDNEDGSYDESEDEATDSDAGEGPGIDFRTAGNPLGV